MMKAENKNKNYPLLYILGLGMAENPGRTSNIVKKSDVLVGGPARLDFFTEFAGERIPVTADIPSLLKKIKSYLISGKSLAVLCSGDPLYFSLGSKLVSFIKTEVPQFSSSIRILPEIASLQATASILGLPWENIRSVSLHGRSDWLPLAHALLAEENIFILTDKSSLPDSIAAFLLDRGYENYSMHIFENIHLDNVEECFVPQKYVLMSLEEARSWNVKGGKGILRSILLERKETIPSTPENTFGLEDALLERDKNIFTKQSVRAAGLAALGIRPGDTVWDVGAGSGAVSIDASRLAWRGKVLSIEKNEGRVKHIAENRRRFKAPNMEIIQGSFPDILNEPQSNRTLFESFSASTLLNERPQRIFIGGGLGNERKDGESAVLSAAWERLVPGGRMVVHCVLLKSLEITRGSLEKAGAKVEVINIQAGKSEPLGGDVFFRAQNPVFLVCADKP